MTLFIGGGEGVGGGRGLLVVGVQGVVGGWSREWRVYGVEGMGVQVWWGWWGSNGSFRLNFKGTWTGSRINWLEWCHVHVFTLQLELYLYLSLYFGIR